jgi:D-3-phosphoglycerate dehydrogenase
MRVIGYDPFITEEAALRLGTELVTLDDLYAAADFISVHTPLTPDTKGLVGDAAFAKMKKGVRVINCARGGIIDEAALVRALESGKVGGAALDVFEEEPPPADHPLLKMKQVVATPHLGASTGEAQLNVAIGIAEQIRDFLVDGTVSSAVNVPSVSAEQAGVLVPYIQLGEKIGSLYAQLATRAPRQIRIEFQGEMAELDTRPVTASVLKGLLANVVETPVNTVNAPFLAKERGIRVSETRNRDTQGFANAIKVHFVDGGKPGVIAGAVFGPDIIRLVRFDDFFLEAIPEGYILILHNRDVPGVVGNVGTFLGKQGINIAGLELGRVSGSAVSFVHVDTPLDAKQLELLRKVPDITGANMVRL